MSSFIFSLDSGMLGAILRDGLAVRCSLAAGRRSGRVKRKGDIGFGSLIWGGPGFNSPIDHPRLREFPEW